MRIASEAGGTFITLEAITGLARLYAKWGDRERALELLLVVLDHPSSLQETRDRAANLRGELGEKLTDQQVEAAQARARDATLEAVVGQEVEPVDL